MCLLALFESLKELYECQVDKKVGCTRLCCINLVKVGTMTNQASDWEDLVLRQSSVKAVQSVKEDMKNIFFSRDLGDLNQWLC